MNPAQMMPRGDTIKRPMTADMVPEATLANTAAHTAANLAKCMEMVEVIENNLFNSGLQDGQALSQALSPAASLSLDAKLFDNAKDSASLAVRLEGIASRIGR